MLKRKQFPRIDIPWLEIKAKLNSNEVATDESKDLLEKAIAHLIWEICPNSFNLEANITDNARFSISISRLPVMIFYSDYFHKRLKTKVF